MVSLPRIINRLITRTANPVSAKTQTAVPDRLEDQMDPGLLCGEMISKHDIQPAIDFSSPLSDRLSDTIFKDVSNAEELSDSYNDNFLNGRNDLLARINESGKSSFKKMLLIGIPTLFAIGALMSDTLEAYSSVGLPAVLALAAILCIKCIGIPGKKVRDAIWQDIQILSILYEDHLPKILKQLKPSEITTLLKGAEDEFERKAIISNLTKSQRFAVNEDITRRGVKIDLIENPPLKPINPIALIIS